MPLGSVYLIPTILHEDEQSLTALPPAILESIKKCQVFFVENDKTIRRFFKRIWKEIVIDNYEWVVLHKTEDTVTQKFREYLKAGKNIGILSEAGCPGVADPGQHLVAVAQDMHATIHPVTGPNSILLALMASGMNGQQFQFHGYLPIGEAERKKAIIGLETDSSKRNCTQIFIETPYRNNSMIKSLLAYCRPDTRLCIATDITSSAENIRTKSISAWKSGIPDIHKKLAIFLLKA